MKTSCIAVLLGSRSSWFAAMALTEQYLEQALIRLRDEMKANILVEFQKCEGGLDARMDKLVATLDEKVQTKFDIVDEGFKNEQQSVRDLVERVRADVASVEGGNIAAVAGQIKLATDEMTAKKAADAILLETVHKTLSLEVQQLRGYSDEAWGRIRHELSGLHAEVAAGKEALRNMSSMDQKPEGRRGGSIRVPDPKNWVLETLKGEVGFHNWRETFDLQIRSVWNGMEKVLLKIRDEKEVVTHEKYSELMQESGLGDKSYDFDWTYAFVSTNIFMVIHTYTDIDPRKVIKESQENVELRHIVF